VIGGGLRRGEVIVAGPAELERAARATVLKLSSGLAAMAGVQSAREHSPRRCKAAGEARDDGARDEFARLRAAKARFHVVPDQRADLMISPRLALAGTLTMTRAAIR
jgi:hypothetical protein